MKTIMTILPAALLIMVLLTGCASKDAAEKKTAGYQQISQEEAAEMMEKDDGHVILDVRRQDEYASGHIPGAICIPNESITTEKPEQLPDLDQIILIYCRSGIAHFLCEPPKMVCFPSSRQLKNQKDFPARCSSGQFFMLPPAAFSRGTPSVSVR